MTDIPIRATVTVGTTVIPSWSDLRLTRGIERFPSDCEFIASKIRRTTFHPDIPDLGIRPGQPVTVRYGTTLLFTGWVDRVVEEVSDSTHTFHVSSRSRCQDLIDCSAEIRDWHGTRTQTTITALAEELGKPYGITVRDMTVTNPQGLPVNPVFEAFSANIGETSYEILERVARSVGLLVYDDPEGNLVLARALGDGGRTASSSPQASVVAMGINLQTLSRMDSIDGRYGTYSVVAQPIDNTSDRRAAANQAGGATTSWIRGESQDPDVDPARNRHLYIVGEQWQGATSLAQARADWEMNRRWGRSFAVAAQVSSWTDLDGQPWKPNTAVAIAAPQIGLVQFTAAALGTDWIVAQVTYSQSAKGGTTADLVLMPKQAFAVQPVGIRRNDADIVGQSRANALPRGMQGEAP